MGSEKPNFLSQPVVKNIFMFRNGDPYYEARRIVINQKRVSNFETLLREVTGGIQPPFGAVRNIYTPRGGHKVECLDGLQSGEQYVAAGRERFKKMDYQQIGSRKRRMLHSLPVPAKPLPPHNRIIVSARFLKPIKEPCTIFVVANGDVLNPAVRLLIHQRMLGQFDRILEMITERMGLRVLGGVRSLYTYEGHQVADGNLLESGQLYVAVGRERFKKLSYSDLLFTRPRGTRRVNGMKAFSLPPIYRFSKQNGNNKSTVRSGESGDGDAKASPPGHQGNNSKEHLSSIVREISQARLISLRKKRSGQSMTLTVSDNDDQESKADDGNADDKTAQEQPAEEKPAEEDAKVAEENGEKAEEQEEPAAGNTKEEEAVEVEEEAEAEDASASKSSDKEEDQDTNGEKEVEEEIKENAEQSNGEEAEATSGPEEKEDEAKEEVKEEEEVTDESKGEVKSEEQGSNGSSSDKSQDSTQKEDGSHPSSEGEKDEQGESTEEEKKDKESEKEEEEEEEEGSKDEKNDVDTEEEQKETGKGSDPGKTQSDSETKDRSNSGDGDREEDVSKTSEDAGKESGEEERRENGEVSGEDAEAESEAEPDTGDAGANGATGGEGGDGGNDDEGGKERE